MAKCNDHNFDPQHPCHGRVDRYLGPHVVLGPGSYEILTPVVTTAPNIGSGSGGLGPVIPGGNGFGGFGGVGGGGTTTKPAPTTPSEVKPTDAEKSARAFIERIQLFTVAEAQKEAIRKADFEASKLMLQHASPEIQAAVTQSNKATEAMEIERAIKFNVDFYAWVTEHFSEKASKMAQALADEAKGKTIRNANDAYMAFQKYQRGFHRKIKLPDRRAIAKGVESINLELLAKNTAIFSKGFLLTSVVMDVGGLALEFKKSLETSDWRPFFIKVEALGVGMAATALVAFAFGFVTATPLTIIGFGFLIAVIGAAITDERVEAANKYLLSL